MFNTPDYYERIRGCVGDASQNSGKSDRELSLEMGKNPSYLNKYKNDKTRFFSIPALLEFCDCTGVQPRDLFPYVPDDGSDIPEAELREILTLADRYSHLSPKGRTALSRLVRYQEDMQESVNKKK